MQPRAKHHRASAAIQIGLGLVFLGAALNYQGILDQYALATYRPAPQVAGFESRVALTPSARASLYRATPQFDDKTSFNADCDTQPHELELGCFFRGRIYVLQIDNASLAPEMDVVSAHELLHAVWARMSPSERKALTTELERVYSGLNDSELTERMAGYAKSEPGEEGNELHSILGTEYTTLSPKLEAHYAKYFPKRIEIVARHEAYQAVFVSRRADLERELVDIRSKKASLSILNRQLDAYRTSNQIGAYNALVPKQNKMVDEINKQIESYRLGVDEYNDLSKSLDSQEITDTEAPAQ